MRVTKSVTFGDKEVRAALEAAYPHLAGKNCQIQFFDDRHGMQTPGITASWVENEIEDWAPKPAAKAVSG